VATLAFQRRLIERAMEIAGGTAALCLCLGVHEHSLKLWLEDRAAMPGRVFLALADLILEDDIRRAAQDRRVRPRSERGEAQSEQRHAGRTNG
jgi:DNA-binding transcriptional regulator YdaS (Cro superfamily)